jgi:phosphopantothenoylcysteine decarboxylase/phosphopantothenate--cysteine ligase
VGNVIERLVRMIPFRQRKHLSHTRAVVTTGATKEAIDDVRCVTNFSTDKFGYAIPKALADSGFDVTVL